MECKYPDCALKGLPFDLMNNGKPYACHNACLTMRTAEVTSEIIMTIDPERRPALTMQQRWDETAEKFKNKTDLKELVRDFFEILDIRETSDEGRKFAPNHISSCRVFDSHKLNAIMPRMKELANE